MLSFGERIFNARMEKGWSLREAAANIGISHTYLSAIEKEYDPRTGNPVTPTPDTLLKICNAYSIPFRDTEKVFSSVNEGDLTKFLIMQLRLLRKSDPRAYRTVLFESEKD